MVGLGRHFSLTAELFQGCSMRRHALCRPAADSEFSNSRARWLLWVQLAFELPGLLQPCWLLQGQVCKGASFPHSPCSAPPHTR